MSSPLASSPNCGNPTCPLCNPILPGVAPSASTYADLTKALSYTMGGMISGPSGISAAFKMAPDNKFTGLPFDLAIGEVYGLRVWRVDSHGRLRARRNTAAPAWRPGTNEARCYGGNVSREHDTPDENCTCGFYAYTEKDHVEIQMTGAGEGPYIPGVVKGTGRTLLGTQGFRCEKAEIVAIQSPAGAGEGGKSSAGRKLADRLAVVYPAIPQLGTRAKLMEFAPVESLLPDPGTEAFWELP